MIQAPMFVSLNHCSSPVARKNWVQGLVGAAHLWCENLLAAPRHCICCLSLIWNRREVGALLLSMPMNATNSMSVNAVCARCWAHQALDEIEHATTDVLRAVVPNGHFEALPC